MSTNQKHDNPLTSEIDLDFSSLLNAATLSKVNQILSPTYSRIEKNKEEHVANAITSKVWNNAPLLLQEIANGLVEDLLHDLKKYNIPYNENSCVIKLSDEINEYQELLNQAEEHYVNWDISYYDPVGLKQEIESKIAEARKAYQEQNRDYYSSVL